MRVCVSVYAHVRGCSQRPEVLHALELELLAVVNCLMWEQNLGPLQKLQVLLTAEPVLRSTQFLIGRPAALGNSKTVMLLRAASPLS